MNSGPSISHAINTYHGICSLPSYCQTKQEQRGCSWTSWLTLLSCCLACWQQDSWVACCVCCCSTAAWLSHSAGLHLLFSSATLGPLPHVASGMCGMCGMHVQACAYGK